MTVVFILETAEDIFSQIIEREDVFWNLVENSVKSGVSITRTDISKVLNGKRDVSKRLARHILDNADSEGFQNYIESLIKQGNETFKRDTLQKKLPENPYNVNTDSMKSENVSTYFVEMWFKYLKDCDSKIQHRTSRKPAAIDPLDIDERIRKVIKAFKGVDEDTTKFTDAKKVKEKINKEEEFHLFKKIEGNVNDYFDAIRGLLIEGQETGDLVYEHVRRKIRHKYQERKDRSPQEIFNGLVDWLALETDTTDREACEAVMSYFVQSCEVF